MLKKNNKIGILDLLMTVFKSKELLKKLHSIEGLLD